MVPTRLYLLFDHRSLIIRIPAMLLVGHSGIAGFEFGKIRMALVVVIVASGGVPVREVSGTGAYGLPVVIAANGRGLPVTIVTSGGIPVVRSGGSPQ